MCLVFRCFDFELWLLDVELLFFLWVNNCRFIDNNMVCIFYLLLIVLIWIYFEFLVFIDCKFNKRFFNRILVILFCFCVIFEVILV